MQSLIDVTATIVVWTATVTFSQFGIEVDFPKAQATHESRTIQRTPRAEEHPVFDDCPDARKARVRAI